MPTKLHRLAVMNVIEPFLIQDVAEINLPCTTARCCHRARKSAICNCDHIRFRVRQDPPTCACREGIVINFNAP
ncbi:hypothetical protein FOBRF1_001278 [Fusarium oxysporum]